jgi:hypothetical protein
MKIYRSCKYGSEIREFELIKETEKQVVYLAENYNNSEFHQEKSNKTSDFHQFFKSYEDAKNFIISRNIGKINNYLLEIARLENENKKIQGVTND